jgi:hypothetical protein
MNALILAFRALILASLAVMLSAANCILAQPQAGDWTCPADFGEFTLTVNAEGTHINKVAYSFSGWSCGSVRLSGGMTLGSTPGWPITDLKFSIENTIGISNDQKMKIEGTFKDNGEEVSGTWNATMSGTNCSGNWGPVVITALEDLEVPSEGVELSPGYPNPLRDQTTISFTLSTDSHVTLAVFDALGREVATLVKTHLPAGIHHATWHATGLPSGLYFSRIETRSYSIVRKLVLLD